MQNVVTDIPIYDLHGIEYRETINPRIRILTGQQFTHLFVLGFIGVRKRGKGHHAVWLTRCSCGTFKAVESSQLLTKRTQSCGCQRDEMIRKSLTRHGYCLHGKDAPEFSSYHKAKQRCESPKDAAYASYGGRGIEFRFNSFEEFLVELGNKPTLQHSIDRIDNDGHYAPGNVRWATMKEQNNNKRDTKFLTIQGVTKPQSAWAEESPVSAAAIIRRLRRGMCAECAVFLMPRSSGTSVGRCSHSATVWRVR